MMQKPTQPGRNIVPVFFWGSIYVMIAITLGLVLLGLWQSRSMPVDAPVNTLSDSVRPAPVIEIESSRLRQLLLRANQQAYDATSARLDELLDTLYAPVFAGIPHYADFHYSIRGEYAELGAAALGRMGSHLEAMLFAGFDERLQATSAVLDTTYATAFQAALRDALQREMPAGIQFESLGTMTQAVINDTLSRAQFTVPVATAAATAGSLAMAKVVSQKIAAKVVAKGAIKGGTSILGGTGMGALAGASFGPIGSAIGAVIGGVGAWLATDAVIISVDEYFNRSEFERELTTLVEDSRAELKIRLQDALAAKQADVDMFTLRQLSEQ